MDRQGSLDGRKVKINMEMGRQGRNAWEWDGRNLDHNRKNWNMDHRLNYYTNVKFLKFINVLCWLKRVSFFLENTNSEY